MTTEEKKNRWVENRKDIIENVSSAIEQGCGSIVYRAESGIDFYKKEFSEAAISTPDIEDVTITIKVSRIKNDSLRLDVTASTNRTSAYAFCNAGSNFKNGLAETVIGACTDVMYMHESHANGDETMSDATGGMSDSMYENLDEDQQREIAESYNKVSDFINGKASMFMRMGALMNDRKISEARHGVIDDIRSRLGSDDAMHDKMEEDAIYMEQQRLREKAFKELK